MAMAGLSDKVSESLIDAGVVGWFQGRAEFDPHALGHRSILADPSRDDAKEILNYTTTNHHHAVNVGLRFSAPTNSFGISPYTWLKCLNVE